VRYCQNNDSTLFYHQNAAGTIQAKNSKRRAQMMSFLEIMDIYFRGEKLEALWFILPAGILLQTFGAVALKA
jgi:hypothetical protein